MNDNGKHLFQLTLGTQFCRMCDARFALHDSTLLSDLTRLCGNGTLISKEEIGSDGTTISHRTTRFVRKDCAIIATCVRCKCFGIVDLNRAICFNWISLPYASLMNNGIRTIENYIQNGQKQKRALCARFDKEYGLPLFPDEYVFCLEFIVQLCYWNIGMPPT